MENTQLNLTLTVNEVNIILKYLGGGAYVEVADVVTKIREQASPQLAAAQAAAAEAAPVGEAA